MNRNTHSGSEGSSPRQLSLAHSFSSSVTRIEEKDEDDHENEPSLVDFWSRPPNCSASPPFEGHA